MGERTGSRVFQWVWSYVLFYPVAYSYELFRKYSEEEHDGSLGRPINESWVMHNLHM
ncbi:hypothetical protein B0T20DRAFT_419005, partial [Sordaria brevicollis]